MNESKPLFLGIDASTPWRAVGLSDGADLRVSANWKATRQEGRDLLPRIESLLLSHGADLKNLKGIAVANGPGSFTSLRVGASVAQGLGIGLRVPVVPIGSLDPYPYQVPDSWKKTVVLLPARSGEVFVGVYVRTAETGWKLENVIECLAIEKIAQRVDGTAIVVGPALHRCEPEIRAAIGDSIEVGGEPCRSPDAGVLADLGRQKWIESPDAFAAASLRIDYRQSHGALTTEERKGVVTRV